MGKYKGPVRFGIVAIDFNGDRYCLDCAQNVIDGKSFTVRLTNSERVNIEDADGEAIVERLLDGDIRTFDVGGVVPRMTESPDIDHWHCGMGPKCCNAVSGEMYEHTSDDSKVGVLLDL